MKEKSKNFFPNLWKKIKTQLTITSALRFLVFVICLLAFISMFSTKLYANCSNESYSFNIYNFIFGTKIITFEKPLSLGELNGCFSWAEIINFSAMPLQIIAYILILIVGLLVLIAPLFIKNKKAIKLGTYISAGVLALCALFIFLTKPIALSKLAKLLDVEKSVFTYSRTYGIVKDGVWTLISAGALIGSLFTPNKTFLDKFKVKFELVKSYPQKNEPEQEEIEIEEEDDESIEIETIDKEYQQSKK